MQQLRDEVVEYIEIAVVELRGLALPRDLAELSELLLDAKDADNEEQLRLILTQAKNLREFCEKRSKSTGNFPKIFPPPGRSRDE